METIHDLAFLKSGYLDVDEATEDEVTISLAPADVGFAVLSFELSVYSSGAVTVTVESSLDDGSEDWVSAGDDIDVDAGGLETASYSVLGDQVRLTFATDGAAVLQYRLAAYRDGK